MFWKYENLTTNNLDSLLDKEDVTLNEILDNEGVIQECKSKQKKLIDFLIRPEIFSELISLIITEPPNDVDETNRYKLPHVASELLCCEVPQFSSAMFQDETLLDKLYSIMEMEAPLNPLLASFFCKAFAVLLTRKSEQNWYDYQFVCVQVIDFLKKKDFVQHALRHIGTSAITDLVLRLMTCVENGEIKTGILEWLNERELVQNIIKLIDVNHDRDTHDNAARLVIEILRVSREVSESAQIHERCEDPILNTLESPETVELVLRIIFGRNSDNQDSHVIPPDSVITNGISIILALLETRTAVTESNIVNDNNNDYGGNFTENMPTPEMSAEDLAKQTAILNNTLNAILPWLEDFTKLLTHPPNLTIMKTTAGILDPPLGQTRLHVAKLVCVLLSTNNSAINLKLMELGTINILLDLFFKYSLNNFLHAKVEECIRLIFAWNNMTNSQESLNLTTTIRVKTPPTVEMVEPNQEEDIKKEDLAAKVNTTDDVENKDGESQALCESKEESEKQETSNSLETPPNSEDNQKTNNDQEQVQTEAEVKEEIITDETKDAHAVAAAVQAVSEEVPEKKEDDIYENPLLVDLYTNCRLVERVINAWEENANDETRPGFHRKGYMGHLTKIANIMHENQSNKTKCQHLIQHQISQYPEELREAWDHFSSQTLHETNERNTLIPPSAYERKHSSSDDEDGDFKDIPFPQDSSTTAQLFSDYQMQRMSENFIDAFGFQDAAFNDDGEDDNTDMNTLTNALSSDSSDQAGQTNPSEASKRSQGIFESICEQRFTSFPGGFDGDEENNEMNQEEDDEEEEDPWADKTKEINFSTNKSPDKAVAESTSSDEEENNDMAKKPKKMEVDEDDDDAAWAEFNHRDEVIESGSTEATAMDTGNPWDSKPLAASTETPFDAPFCAANPTTEEGWADFANNKDSPAKSTTTNSKSEETPTVTMQ